jgi:hypothetical protein
MENIETNENLNNEENNREDKSYLRFTIAGVAIFFIYLLFKSGIFLKQQTTLIDLLGELSYLLLIDMALIVAILGFFTLVHKLSKYNPETDSKNMLKFFIGYKISRLVATIIIYEIGFKPFGIILTTAALLLAIFALFEIYKK